MTLQSFNVWVIYQTNTLEHSILSFFLILESLNDIWASFDISALRCYNKRQGRKLRPVWRQNTLQKRVKFAHKNSIYSQYFSLDSQFMAHSFSLCSLLRYTFSFQRASWAKSWNMTAKRVENDARTSQVDQFAVVIVRPRLGTWSIVTLPVEGTKRFWSYNLCLTRLPVRRTFVSLIFTEKPINQIVRWVSKTSKGN